MVEEKEKSLKEYVDLAKSSIKKKSGELYNKPIPKEVPSAVGTFFVVIGMIILMGLGLLLLYGIFKYLVVPVFLILLLLFFEIKDAFF